jgi:hypothetical protein
VRNGPSQAVLASAASWRPRVASWLGGQLLADDLPVIGGRLTWDASNKVVDSAEITFARFDGLTDYLPTDPLAPLARYGQQLDVTITVAGVDVRMGRYQIDSWKFDESTVRVSASGLMQIAADSRFLDVKAPRDDGTMRSEFTRLVPEQLAVQFDSALTDRGVPKTMSWDESRIDALYDIADAWPAVIRPDAWGQVLVKPPVQVSPTPVMSVKDGEGGTVVAVPRQDTRDGVYNIVKASSSADGVEASAIAYVTAGPMAVATYNPVPRFYASDMLQTVEQCQATANAMRDESTRRSSILQVTMAPDPRPELDDTFGVTREGRLDLGVVVAVDMPLTVADGDMRVDVGVL